MPRLLNEDRGSIAPLAVGLALISLITALMAVSAGSIFLLERRLTSLAEFAALSRIESGMEVSDFLLETQPQGFSLLKIEKDAMADGVTAEVQLCATWNAPLSGYFKFASRRVCGFGAARSN